MFEEQLTTLPYKAMMILMAIMIGDIKEDIP
jgi:hypothetical protein